MLCNNSHFHRWLVRDNKQCFRRKGEKLIIDFEFFSPNKQDVQVYNKTIKLVGCCPKDILHIRLFSAVLRRLSNIHSWSSSSLQLLLHRHSSHTYTLSILWVILINQWKSVCWCFSLISMNYTVAGGKWAKGRSGFLFKHFSLFHGFTLFSLWDSCVCFAWL